MPRRLLIVDDDASIREALRLALADEFDIDLAESGEAAIGYVARATPDIVLSDVRMSGMTGLALLALLRERAPGIDVVLMSAFDDMPTVVAAMRGGALDFIPKPLELADVRRVLGRVFNDRRTRARAQLATEHAARQFALNELVGRDPRMIETYKLVGQAASVRSNVLIRGESGTGKELIARAIHFNSPDAQEPFVALNCTALPATLLESELFGHTRGAFTGAHAARRGRFELAGRGTIFLDEIGDTSPDFQAKLLRVLQEREFYPVGAERAERTEARVLAATHRNLEEQIERGAFRADLYYRLRVVEIRIPPLRERRGDIPRLAEHLLRTLSASMHRSVPTLTADAVQLLSVYDWPGNVRELENVLTNALVVARGEVIHRDHLLIAGRDSSAGANLEPLDTVERLHIERVLAAAAGRKAESARILGVSRPRLDRLLAKYGLH